MSSSRFKNRILIIVAMFALFLSGVASFTNSYTSAEAGMFCGAIGSDVQPRKVGGMFQGASNPEAPNREWTAEELFRNSIGFSTYYGEGEKTWWYADTSERGSGADGYEEAKDKIEAERGCVNFNFIPNMIVGATNLITGITGTITLTLVGEDIMAETLGNIIGGDGSNDEGLIGTFLSSFYMPLVVIAVIIMTVTIIYKGLIQFKMREALSSIIWTLGAFIVGVALMLNPQLLTSIPQKATSTITTCVLGALSGQNCLSGEIETPSMLASRECLSTVTSGSDAESVVNSMNCTIWKTFTLEPWAESQFGAPYNELYTKNPPDGGKIWSNLPEDKEDKYCINFTSSDSYEDSVRKGSPTMNGAANGEVCNVALYHLFLRTNMIDNTSQDGNNQSDGFVVDDTGRYDKRWYDIIIPMSGDDSRWDNWAGTQFWSRTGTSLMGLIAVSAASTVLLTLAVFGGAYKVVGLILMAFAPIFFLFAIEPTRGRRIFLGWLETLVSSILKYFAITVMIIVALVMYAGLLSNTSGPMTLVGVIVLTFALHMYRKEIVDLIGMSNMGGQRLSNKAKDVGGWAARHAKEKTAASVGGALGGTTGRLSSRRANVKAREETVKDLQKKLSNATSDDERNFYSDEIKKENEAIGEEGSFIGTAIKGSAAGSVDSVKRSMKRGTGTMANAYQQAGRTKSDLDNQAKKDRAESKKQREKFEADRLTSPTHTDNSSDVPEENEKVVEANEKPVESPIQPKEEVVEAEYEVITESSWEEEFEKARDNLDDIEYEGDLSQEEINELDKFVDKIRNNQNDDDLLDLVRQDDVLNDPNKKKLVSNEINARLNAYNEVGVSVGSLAGATALDRAGSVEEFKATLETIKTDYKMNPMPASLDEYSNGLADLGIPPEEIARERMSLLEDAVDNQDYNKALNVTLDNGYTTSEEIQKSTGSTDSEAEAIMELMEHKGIVRQDPENENVRIVIDDPKGPEDPNDDPKGPEDPNDDPKGPENPNDDPKGPENPNDDPKGPENPNHNYKGPEDSGKLEDEPAGSQDNKESQPGEQRKPKPAEVAKEDTAEQESLEKEEFKMPIYNEQEVVEDESKTNEQTRTEVEPKPNEQTRTEVEQKSNEQTRTEAEPKPNQQTRTEAEPKPNEQTRTEAEPKPNQQTRTEVEQKSNEQTRTEAEPKPNEQTRTEAEPKSNQQTRTHSEKEGEYTNMSENDFAQNFESKVGRHEPEVDTRFDSADYDEKEVHEEVRDELADELESMRAEMAEYLDNNDEDDR